ncbi:phosphomannomutase [Ramlibacter sp. 2FC]|uniref:phosphomannomutase n=1 Tax=Ramlibacter sp. 2FC TaxID=2502188 RepID=UPI00201DF3ED|nr:phosphomannomutase [Ramlibacter sp. 2FC]
MAFGTSGARGLVTRMTPDVCSAYAQAFLRAVCPEAKNLVIGHDLRPSSPAMAAACAQAAANAGLEVAFVGALPTPAVAHYAATLHAPSIIITGSHIPFDRNGIKFYRAEGEISKADEQAMLSATVALPQVDELLSPLPPVEVQAQQVYLRRYVDFFGAQALQGLRVAVYEHSSAARDVLRSILEALGAQVLSLGRTDTFVPIDTEAVRQEDIAQARQWAQAHGFDAILSTDGDADRPLIGDEQGNWLRGDVVGILCAQYLGADVVVTPVSSNTAVEQSAIFARVIRTRIGSPHVIAGMEDVASMQAPSRKEEPPVVVGYEANGGFLLGSEVVRSGGHLKALPTRDAVLPMLALLCMAREKGCRLSELSAHLPRRYTASDRLQDFATETSRELIARLGGDMGHAAELLASDAGPVVAANTIDGLRLTFANGDIVHLRPSGNAPELRCYAEADSEARARALCDGALQSVLSLSREESHEQPGR